MVDRFGCGIGGLLGVGLRMFGDNVYMLTHFNEFYVYYMYLRVYMLLGCNIAFTMYVE